MEESTKIIPAKNVNSYKMKFLFFFQKKEMQEIPMIVEVRNWVEEVEEQWKEFSGLMTIECEECGVRFDPYQNGYMCWICPLQCYVCAYCRRKEV